MKTFENLNTLGQDPGSGTAITIGVFDGLHIGHQSLIMRTMETAQAQGNRSLVITFAEHPLSVLAPPFLPKRLLYRDRKTQLIAAMGADMLAEIEFTEQFASQNAESFVEATLIGQCGMKSIICGYDFTFGKSGRGNIALLREMGKRFGFGIEVVDAVSEQGVLVKSSHIRDLLFAGDVQKASALLTRPFELRGEVVQGFGRGHTIGFPTANLAVSETHAIPARGVYFCAAVAHGQRVVHGAMVNIGVSPTFGNNRFSIEAHLLNIDQDLRGKALSLFFLRRLRDERRFDSAEALITHLQKDHDESMRLLGDESIRQDWPKIPTD